MAFVKLTSISILALPLTSCVTLGGLFSCLNLCFLICMMGKLIFLYLTHQQHVRVPVASHPCQYSVVSAFQMLAVLKSV